MCENIFSLLLLKKTCEFLMILGPIRDNQRQYGYSSRTKPSFPAIERLKTHHSVKIIFFP
jgi:hypothetical protein